MHLEHLFGHAAGSSGEWIISILERGPQSVCYLWYTVLPVKKNCNEKTTGEMSMAGILKTSTTKYWPKLDATHRIRLALSQRQTVLRTWLGMTRRRWSTPIFRVHSTSTLKLSACHWIQNHQIGPQFHAHLTKEGRVIDCTLGQTVWLCVSRRCWNYTGWASSTATWINIIFLSMMIERRWLILMVHCRATMRMCWKTSFES